MEEALVLTDIKLAYNRNELSEYIPGIISTEELVYYRFFEDNEHNHVDSGVVVLNKRRKFNGLLLGITLNLTPLLHPCSHGDKEFFWLGRCTPESPTRSTHTLVVLLANFMMTIMSIFIFTGIQFAQHI